MSTKLEVVKLPLPPGHPLGQLPPDSPMQLHGTFTARHQGRSFSVILTRDDVGVPRGGLPDWRWHISVAGQDKKVPAWDTIAALGHEIRPGVAFALGVPPKSWWINVHPGCLHLWEVKDDNLLAQWRSERRGDKPT